MNGRPRLKVNTAEFTRMYNNGVQIVDIAQHFHICVSSVHKIRVQLNLPIRQRRRVEFDENKYRRLFDEDLTYSMMARKLGISRRVVMAIRKRLYLPNRKRGKKKL
jgi:hypothetical protein